MVWHPPSQKVGQLFFLFNFFLLANTYKWHKQANKKGTEKFLTWCDQILWSGLGRELFRTSSYILWQTSTLGSYCLLGSRKLGRGNKKSKILYLVLSSIFCTLDFNCAIFESYLLRKSLADRSGALVLVAFSPSQLGHELSGEVVSVLTESFSDFKLVARTISEFSGMHWEFSFVSGTSKYSRKNSASFDHSLFSRFNCSTCRWETNYTNVNKVHF